MIKQRIVEMVIKRQLEKVLPNLKKKIGTVPRKRPIVVKPKARPGVFCKAETSNARVIDMVMLKSATPIREIIIKLSPKSKNGKEPTTEIIAVFLNPILSDKIPPRALPTPIEQYNKIFSKTVLFQEVGMP